MSLRRIGIIGGWLAFVLAASLVAARAHYLADLSAFLPAHPTPTQSLLIDQLRAGPGSRLILIALEGGEAPLRARISRELAARLRSDPEFSSVNNGEDVSADRDRKFVFEHRYVLSEAVDAERFSAAGLRAALGETVSDLASSEGLLINSLTPHDPTGETLRVVEQLSRTPAPRSQDGVWVSLKGERALLVAETRAEGSDTDAEERALGSIRTAFAAAIQAADAGSRGLVLRMSGPAVFSVDARARIERAVVRLSLAASVLIIVVLVGVYRSLTALVLGLLPVASGALAGVAAVALGFGAVHGITLGFGITLIGESVDYSVYFFIQSRAAAAGSLPGTPQDPLWSTMILGMLTSVCGFASLLPSGFSGLAQLGLYSICGLVIALAVTRYVLPELLPRHFRIHDLTPLGLAASRLFAPLWRQSAKRRWAAAAVLAGSALIVLGVGRGHLWNRELSSLSPVPAAELGYDAELRSDLGAPSALDLVVIPGESLEAALRGAESAARVLAPLVAQGVLGGFDSPANYLPSESTQALRRASLPEPATLRANLDRATAGLPLDPARLGPFLEDVEAARHALPVTPQDLRGTSLGTGLDALMLHNGSHWDALMPLRARDRSAPDIDVAQVRRAFAAAASSARVLDMKHESDALYAGYLREAIRLSLWGLAAIAALLGLWLRSAPRTARVLAPLVLAVLTVGAALALAHRELTILHLVGMLLIVAVGSNYALFFDRRREGEAHIAPLTLASLAVANTCTVIGFGLLCFSGVPVLEALGETVAPGTLLALVFAGALTRAGPAASKAPAGA
jgi:predicted exporter